MPIFDESRRILSERLPELRSRYGVVELGVFGSFARNEQQAGSDLDILVPVERPIGFFGFTRLENHLQEILGVRVDLVSCKALKPATSRRILSEVRFVAWEGDAGLPREHSLGRCRRAPAPTTKGAVQ